jgi:hypothetical protein
MDGGEEIQQSRQDKNASRNEYNEISVGKGVVIKSESILHAKHYSIDYIPNTQPSYS